MSEPATGRRMLPVRARAAAALRRLSHALVSHQCDPELLDRITATANALADEAEQAPPRRRPVTAMKRRLWEGPPAKGEAMTHFAECIVSGAANPMGIGIRVHRHGDEAVAAFNLGAAFEGAPRRAHGGIVSAIFDDVMGYVTQLLQVPAYTGRLTVHFRAPVPVGEDLSARGWLERRDGRKLFMRSEMAAADGTVIAEAEALFIAIPPERFGLPASEISAAD